MLRDRIEAGSIPVAELEREVDRWTESVQA
jgi:hypothetical protein